MKRIFRSKAAADLIMMSPTGEQLLLIIGKEATAQGIVELGQIAAAVQALEQAIAADEAARNVQPRPDPKPDGQDHDGTREQRVGLRQRAWPLLDMMKRSLAERADVVWGV